MALDYNRLLQEVLSRSDPDNRDIGGPLTEEFRHLNYSDALAFASASMKAVDPTYSRRTKEAGECAKKHLETSMPMLDYEFQGSVMTNTHIRGYSDIDLVVITEKYYSFNRSAIEAALNPAGSARTFTQEETARLRNVINTPRYNGDPTEDLKQLRSKAERILSDSYDDCDITGAKAIKVVNNHLNRKVDVVVANWFHNINAIIADTRSNERRGIQVFDKAKNLRGLADYPFLSIYRINERGRQTNGHLKKMIRLAKNCKSNLDQESELSSFDINAVCYNIEPSKYATLPDHLLVGILFEQLDKIATDDQFANSLMSVDGEEAIFLNKPHKREQLATLCAVVFELLADIHDTLNSRTANA